MNISTFEETNPISLLLQFKWLSQAKLAKILGVGKSIISMWLCGKRSPKRAIKKLAWELQQQLKQWPNPHCLFSFSTHKINPIQLLKKYRGLSRADLAEALGVTVNSVNRWACGHQKPSPAIQRLAHELDKKWSAAVLGL